MAGELRTGHEVIDALQDLQLVANRISDPDAKINHVRDVIGLLATKDLLERQFMVSSFMTFGKSPDGDPQQRTLFSREMLFIAELDAYAYMLDYDIPIDSLTLRFQKPEVLDVAPEDSRAYKKLSLQVPVLAIDSFVSLEAA